MRRLAGLCLIVVSASFACSKDDDSYIHVYVQGSGTALESQPFKLSVTALGEGRHTELEFDTALHAAAGPATRPFADFLFETGSPRVELRVLTQGALDNVEWGGDVRLEPPSKDKPIVITLTRAESRLVEDSVALLDTDGDASTLFAGGVASAYSDGASIREFAIDPDRPVIRRRTVCDDCKETKVLRLASRPLAPFGSDIYAIGWLDRGRVLLKTTTRSETEYPVVEVSNGAPSDVRIACFKKGGAADVVVARLEGDAVTVSTHDLAGKPVGTAHVAVTGAPERQLVGVVTASDGTILLGVRGPSSRIVRLSATGERLNEAVLRGDLRAIGLTADGNRLLAATSESLSASASRIDLVTYSVRDLVESAPASVVSTRAVPLGVSLSHVSLSSCALGWSEPRDDGSDGVDVHVQRIDDDGRPKDLSFFGNLATTSAWFSPTILCASPTRAFVTFYSRQNTDTGNLWLRRLP